jgi:hypothetical protein
MTLSHKIPTVSIVFLTVLAAAAALLVTAEQAQAEDRRACVSKREFYGARDFGIVIPPGHDWMSRVPPPTDNPIGRRTLEDKWDVRGRGLTVTDTLASAHAEIAQGAVDTAATPKITNPLVRMKMYRTCEHPLNELQVYVGYHKDTNLVLWTMWWPSRLG